MELERELECSREMLLRMGSPDDHSLWARFAGGAAKCEVRSTVEGELSDDILDVVMGVLSDIYESAGQVTRVGRRFLWTLRSVGEHRDLEVTLVQRRGSVVVCARHRFADVASSVYVLYALAFLLLVVVATLLSRAPLGPASIPAAAIGGLCCFASARAIYRRSTRKHSRRLRFAVAKIEETIRLAPTRPTRSRATAADGAALRVNEVQTGESRW